MAKFSSIFVFVLYNASTFIKQGNSTGGAGTEGNDQLQESAQKYPPYMVLQDRENSSTELADFIMPSKYVNIDGKLSWAADMPDLKEFALCPELKTNNEPLKRALRSINQDLPETNACLFVAKFQENEQQMCDKEPKPWLAVSKDEIGNKFICGVSDRQKLITVAFYNCGTEEYLANYYEKISAVRELNTEQPRFITKMNLMYEICYDFDYKTTLWTRHDILGPELITHKYYPHKNLNTVDLNEFSVDTFELAVDPGTFADMKHAYESINANMKIYPLVPKDHMAQPYWKKSVDHMINSAPLLPEFIPLMKAIHNGILLAANHLRRKFNQALMMYTKAKTIYSLKHNVSSSSHHETAMKHLMLETPTDDVFQPNKWHIIVHNEDDESGMLIVLHNTRKTLPAKKECDDEKRLPCDFKSWAEDPDSITANHFENAFCCPITKTEYSIGNLVINIQKDLDMQEIIRSEKDELSKTVVHE